MKPVIGCEVYVTDDRHQQKKGQAHLTLLAETTEGYGNLIHLSSLGYLEGYYYKPRVDWELLERYAPGLVALSGCLSGRVCQRARGGPRRRRRGRARPADDDLRPRQRLRRDAERASRRAAADQPRARAARRAARPAARRHRRRPLPPARGRARARGAALHPVRRLAQEPEPLEVRHRPVLLQDALRRWLLDFPGHDDALRRTLEIAERCNVEIELDRILLPHFPTPDGRDAFDYLVELCEKGLERRYEKSTADLQRAAQVRAEDDQGDGVRRLLPHRLRTSSASRSATGSASAPAAAPPPASLVAYCLEITDLDPIRYDLLFERFLNPGRKSMPDIDIDFAVDGRERVINYVAEKYGRDRVAQIITFGTMAARAAVRDAGRVLEVPYGVVDKVAKLIPEGPGQTLEECLKPGAELRQAYDADPVAREIVDLAKPLEGPHAPGLDPRRRRRHRRRAADEHRPAPAEGRRPGDRDAVLDERRRGARPAEDGLPRPAQPRRDRQGVRARRQPRHRHDPARRPQDVRDARARRGDRRLPVRVVGHARGAAAGEADASSTT